MFGVFLSVEGLGCFDKQKENKSERKGFGVLKKKKIKTIKQVWNYKQLKMCRDEQIGSVCASSEVYLLGVCRVCEKQGGDNKR